MSGLSEQDREALDVMGMFPTSEGFARPAEWERETETRLARTVEAIVARHVRAALTEAAEDLNRDGVSFRPGWGSGNAEDLAALDALTKAVGWLRDRAASLSPEG